MALLVLFLALLHLKSVFAAVAVITAAPKLEARADIVVGYRLTSSDSGGESWQDWAYNAEVLTVQTAGSALGFCPIEDGKPMPECRVKTSCKDNTLYWSGGWMACPSPKTCASDFLLPSYGAKETYAFYSCRTEPNYTYYARTEGVPVSTAATPSTNPEHTNTLNPGFTWPSHTPINTLNPTPGGVYRSSAPASSGGASASTEDKPVAALPTNSSLSQENQGSKKGGNSNTKVIVGGVVGGLAVVGATVFATVFLLRRQRRNNGPQSGGIDTDPPSEPYYDANDTKYNYAHTNSWIGPPAEVHGDPMPPQELPGHAVVAQPEKAAKELSAGGQ
ncbi:hypothetical protein BS50DRAFT_615088 [Corynespora cassiicola Philippines]|uniref:Mid2 domain-containing protein n=1 Tax=Corynespora cassiicola Philippines TaxID=1448308 RepID=A0A2T2P8Z6_CORCC|nr:hypothetical protein BS50DRAFT_615088 [Corynespora cassiicola Philippines]